MKLLNLILIAASVAVSACSTMQPVAQFQPVNLQPVKQHIEQTQAHVVSAHSAAKALESECASKTKGWQAAYDALNSELDAAYTSAQLAKESLADKQVEVITLTKQANVVAVERNKAVAQVSVEHARGNKWLKTSLLLFSLLLASVAWITKRLWLPLLLGMIVLAISTPAPVTDRDDEQSIELNVTHT